VLYCFFVISHDRRQILHFNVTEHPTPSWIVQQLRGAFPEDRAAEYLILDRDAKFGGEVTTMLEGLGSELIQTAYHSPWQTASQSDLLVEHQLLYRIPISSLAIKASNPFVNPWNEERVPKAGLLDRSPREETVGICLVEKKKPNLVADTLNLLPQPGFCAPDGVRRQQCRSENRFHAGLSAFLGADRSQNLE
jgi:hypothetical protein